MRIRRLRAVGTIVALVGASLVVASPASADSDPAWDVTAGQAPIGLTATFVGTSPSLTFKGHGSGGGDMSCGHSTLVANALVGNDRAPEHLLKLPGRKFTAQNCVLGGAQFRAFGFATWTVAGITGERVSLGHVQIDFLSITTSCGFTLRGNAELLYDNDSHTLGQSQQAGSLRVNGRSGCESIPVRDGDTWLLQSSDWVMTPKKKAKFGPLAITDVS